MTPLFQKVLDALADRLAFHRKTLIRTKEIYCGLRIVLGLLIPIGATTLTWATTSPLEFFKNNPEVVGVGGLILVIFTIIFSVFRPTERYMTASHMLVTLHDWEMDLIIKLHCFDSKETTEIYNFLQKKRPRAFWAWRKCN